MEFADTIFMIDNADVVIEDSNIFLKYLCSSCNRKLQTLPSKATDIHILLKSLKNIMTAVLFFPVHQVL